MSVGEDPALYRPGVGAMLINDEGRVFVGQRIDMTEEAWQMPQGGIEPGEAPRLAVLRELAEEIGTDRADILVESPVWRCYALPTELAGRMWGGRFIGQRMKWFLLAFTGTDADIRPDRVAQPEFRAWQWVDPRRLSSLIVPFKKRLYETVVAEFLPLIEARHAHMAAPPTKP